MPVWQEIGQPKASISPDFILRRKKSNPGPYRPWKKPYCTVFRELATFGQDQARFPGTVSDGEWGLRECIFPQVFRRNVLRREITFSVVNDHPDPLSSKYFQEFRIRQGVGGSQSGHVWGSVPEKWGIGARTGGGLGMVRIPEKEGHGGVLKGIYGVKIERLRAGFSQIPAGKISGIFFVNFFGREKNFRKFF